MNIVCWLGGVLAVVCGGWLGCEVKWALEDLGFATYLGVHFVDPPDWALDLLDEIERLPETGVVAT